MLQAPRIIYSGSKFSGDNFLELGHFLLSMEEAFDAERVTESTQ